MDGTSKIGFINENLALVYGIYTFVISKASFVNEKERAVYNKNKIDLTLIVQIVAFWLLDFSAQFFNKSMFTFIHLIF